MITFARALGTQGVVGIADFYAGKTGDTNATNTSAQAGAYTPKKGDIVALNDQGRVAASVLSSSYINGTKLLGVCEGGEFQGIATGGVYAASAANQNDMTSGTIAKVNDALGSSVWRIDLKSGVSAPTVGNSYAVYVDTNEGALLDTGSATGTKFFQVLEYEANGGAFGTGAALGVFVAADIAVDA